MTEYLGVYVWSVSIPAKKFQSIHEGNWFFLFFLAFPNKSLSRARFTFFLGLLSELIVRGPRETLSIARKLSRNEKIRPVRCAFGKVGRATICPPHRKKEERRRERKDICAGGGGGRSFRIRCLEEQHLKIRMFRWLSRKGGVQSGYTRRVIDLRHSKILGSNRASMNLPLFLSLLSLSPFPRLIAAIVLLIRVRRRIGGILSMLALGSPPFCFRSQLEIPRI